MSFANTRTPLKPTCKAKYVVPSRPKNGAMEFYLTEELAKEFRRLFPTTLNTKMMELFGLSHATLHRFARQMQLTKDMAVIRHKQAQISKRICEKNGYYASLRGKPLSEACRKASYEYQHSDRYKHPLQIVKEQNSRRYHALMRKRSKQRKHVHATERMRLDAGLQTRTRIHTPFTPYTKREVNMRYGFFQLGYILGSKWDEDGERMTIFYDDATVRRPRKERNAEKLGFVIRPLD